MITTATAAPTTKTEQQKVVWRYRKDIILDIYEFSP
jgi:hypothetical protein